MIDINSKMVQFQGPEDGGIFATPGTLYGAIIDMNGFGSLETIMAIEPVDQGKYELFFQSSNETGISTFTDIPDDLYSGTLEDATIDFNVTGSSGLVSVRRGYVGNDRYVRAKLVASDTIDSNKGYLFLHLLFKPIDGPTVHEAVYSGFVT